MLVVPVPMTVAGAALMTRPPAVPPPDADPSDSFITEDGLSLFVTEDGQFYIAQE